MKLMDVFEYEGKEKEKKEEFEQTGPAAVVCNEFSRNHAHLYVP